mmetsp:Transcript_7055/g.13444  ORF Transcript_7055/g.13444 Transcript_7055/m.13444 type:complete len:109 (+) Transcript_7055:208-534(+)
MLRVRASPDSDLLRVPTKEREEDANSTELIDDDEKSVDRRIRRMREYERMEARLEEARYGVDRVREHLVKRSAAMNALLIDDGKESAACTTCNILNNHEECKLMCVVQ